MEPPKHADTHSGECMPTSVTGICGKPFNSTDWGIRSLLPTPQRRGQPTASIPTQDPRHQSPAFVQLVRRPQPAAPCGGGRALISTLVRPTGRASPTEGRAAQERVAPGGGWRVARRGALGVAPEVLPGVGPSVS